MTGKKGWLIGELSDRVNISTHTIRYYERLGLLEPLRRTESQYRIYDQEIKQLIAIRTQGTPPCASLKTMVKQHLDDLDRKIEGMMSLRQELASRYEEISKLLPNASTLPTEEICQGKICGLIESIE